MDVSEPTAEDARSDSRIGSETESEDDFGYEEEFSVGIDLPQGPDTTSGNVTPIPTTGELEELSISSQDDATVVAEPPTEQESRATPLKSLLKKPSVDMDTSSGESDSDDGKVSPKKVHFSEIDQVKLMSQDSVASMVASESGSDLSVTNLVTATSPIATNIPQGTSLTQETSLIQGTSFIRGWDVGTHLPQGTRFTQGPSMPEVPSLPMVKPSYLTNAPSPANTRVVAAMMADRQMELTKALAE